MADGDDRPRVLVDDRQDLPLDAASLAALARSTLVAEGETEVELSLSFVPEDEIAALHVGVRGLLGKAVAKAKVDGVTMIGLPEDKQRRREGFALTDPRMDMEAALDHALSLGVALLDNDPALGHVMRVNLPEGLTP